MPRGWDWGMQPRFRFGTSNFPTADTDYGKGFRDGCSIFWSSVGKGMTSDFIKQTLDTKMLSGNPDYREGWADGMEQCTYIIDHDVI